jgi:hypothetical protein
MSRWPGHNLLYSLLAQARNPDSLLYGYHLTRANGFVCSKSDTQTIHSVFDVIRKIDVLINSFYEIALLAITQFLVIGFVF